MQRYRVLVIGGYGLFGARLVERLSRQPDLRVVVAGRSAAKASALIEALRATSHAELDSAMLDVAAPTLAQQIGRLAPRVVVHTAGPFQAQRYQVAIACIANGSHYIDLADGREFVNGIGALDRDATAAKVLVSSGASSVPALSSAAVDWLARDLARVHRIDIGISPGNRTERGLATVQSILSYCGVALPSSGARRTFGWTGSRRHLYP